MQKKEIGKLSKHTITEQIYDILKYYIISEKWKPGFKLPSENELADSFGVSRMSIRMVLQKLSALRLVETRVGEGTFIKKFNFKKYVDEVSDFIVKPEMLHQINEFRKDFEINCLELAITRADSKDMKELEDKFQLFMKVDTLEKYLACDYQFHLQICKMSKNSIYVMIFEQIMGLVENYFRANMEKSIKKFGIEGALQDGKNLHKKIEDAIKARDFETAKVVYLSMIDWLFVD